MPLKSYIKKKRSVGKLERQINSVSEGSGRMTNLSQLAWIFPSLNMQIPNPWKLLNSMQTRMVGPIQR